MERHEVLEMMATLKLAGMRDAFDELLADGLKRRHPVQRIIGELLKAEIADKQARSIKYQMSVAKLPLAKELADFEFTDTPVNEPLVREFAAGGFLPNQRHAVLIGGTGTGKTTLLNVVSAFIPDRERIVTIEDTAELQLKRDHIVRLEYRPPNVEGRGEVTIRQLVINALRMRPDRIVVGEARGGEALDMLQAMNTGHDGSLTTIHSNSPRDTLRRIETMVLMAGMELPLKAIREQLASAIELVVHLERMRDGTRRVVKVTEVQGMEGESVVMQDLFEFKQTGFQAGRVLGDLESTGLRPKFADKFAVNGIELPKGIFAGEAEG